MGKINILSDDICNRIAAGEVIDRPYSVVKELVENSIDAGANDIEIHIERGGKQLIKVCDNGCGIEKDDMRAAFFAHATSKISCLEDIDDIKTLGFRGEALATIASVAQVELLSAIDGADGNKLECDGEFIGKTQPAVCQKGTQIVVRNLFFNTPVRYKFMRTDKKEEGDITNIVTRFILGNPKISFRYYIDGKISLQSYGGGLEEAIAQDYGANVLPNCFKIDVVRNDLHISGFIGNQNFFKPNKTYQSVFLNGRYIVNPVIAGAITNAYMPYAMKRQYAFYVLNIDMPREIVDVNVHPNKADVRFVDNALIYGTVYKVLSSILDGTAKAAEYVVENKVVPEIQSTFSANPNHVYSEFTDDKNVKDDNFNDVEGIEKFVKSAKKETQEKKEDKPDFSYLENYEAPPQALGRKDLIPNRYFEDEELKKNRVMVFGAGHKDEALSEQLAAIEEKRKARQAQIEFNTYKFRGALFNTYLVYEYRDDIYLIDQHAAHERLIYDEICAKSKVGKLPKQLMLVPYIFTVNAEEQEFIEKNMEAIWRMGFRVEPFGMKSYRVAEVPADLPDLDAKAFFDDILSNVGEWKKLDYNEIMKDKIAQTACKHAIKGGDRLTDSEIDKLFVMLDGNFGLKCPHGRPICVKISRSELEKMFKRKV